MKILIGNDGFTAHYFQRLGLQRAFQFCGHNTVLWNINEKPVNDIFDEFEPDIFIFQTYNLTKTIINAIIERPHIKCTMKAADWSSFMDQQDIEEFHVLVASQKEIDNTFYLFEKCGQPEYVHIHYHSDYVPITHEYWIKNGIPAKSVLLAADTFEYMRGQKLPELESDICFIGGYWPYKARVLDKYLLPLCRKDYRIKIFGNWQWPTHKYCGFLPLDMSRHAFASSIICPNLSEPHSQEFGFDIIERPYKLLLNQSFVISDYVEGLEKLYPKSIVYAKSPEEFNELIDYYIKNQNERIPFIKSGFVETVKNHTYFDRIIQTFRDFRLVEDEEKAILAKKAFFKQMGIII